MKGTAKTIVLMATLVLAATGFEALAQSANSTKQVQVKNQQKQIEQYTLRDQAQIANNGQENAKGQKAQNSNRAEKGKKSGPADGSGNQDNRPKDGTGYGSDSGNKAGPQDGTGPQYGPGGRNNGGAKGRRGGRH